METCGREQVFENLSASFISKGLLLKKNLFPCEQLFSFKADSLSLELGAQKCKHEVRKFVLTVKCVLLVSGIKSSSFILNSR